MCRRQDIGQFGPTSMYYDSIARCAVDWVCNWWMDYHDNKVHWANVGPTWGRQDPGGLHVGPMNFNIWVGSVGDEDSNTVEASRKAIAPRVSPGSIYVMGMIIYICRRHC